MRPILHTFLRFAATGLALFTLIYGLHLAVTGEVFPPWNDVSIFFTCVTLSLLFTFYRPALRQLPLLFFALSAISIRFLTGLLTPVWDLYDHLSFSVATWGILALLSPPARFVRERACYVFLAGFLMTLPALVTWSCYFLTGSFPQPETLLALLQTNISEAAGYLSGHLSLPLLLCLPLYFGALFLISGKSSTGDLFSRPSLLPRLALLLVAPVSLTLSYSNPVTTPWIGIKDYMKAYADFEQKSKERTSRLTDLTISSAPGLYVLAIGESENSEHMSVYGYPRPTTPWLSSRRNDPHFLFFDDAYSCYVQTVPALSYALTAKNQYNDISLAAAPLPHRSRQSRRIPYRLDQQPGPLQRLGYPDHHHRLRSR